MTSASVKAWLSAGISAPCAIMSLIKVMRPGISGTVARPCTAPITKAKAPTLAALCASAMPRGGAKGLAARSHRFTV